MKKIKATHKLTDFEYQLLKFIVYHPTKFEVSVQDVISELGIYFNDHDITPLERSAMAIVSLCELHRLGLLNRSRKHNIHTVYWANKDIEIQI